MQTVQGLSKENQETLVTVLWAAWFARNKFVFHGNRNMEIAEAHLSDYRAAMKSRPKMLSRVGSNVWRLPPSGAFKLNKDAAFQMGVGIGIGVVMRDDTRRVHWRMYAEQMDSSLSVDSAEAIAVRQGTHN